MIMLHKMLGRLSKTLEILSAAGLIVLFALIYLQMAGRYLGLSKLGWTDELVSCTTTWMVFLGTSYLTERGGHISINLFADSQHGIRKKLLLMLIQMINIVCGTAIIYSGYIWIGQTANKVTPYLQIEYNIWYAAILVFGILSTFFSVFKLIDAAAALFEREA